MATLMMTVAVFTFVLLLGNVLKEILTLLVTRQVSLSVVLLAIGLLIPYVLVFALPMGLLTSTLLVFGRLSSDQELTAIRASGVSLVGLITPVLILSLLLSGLSAVITMEVAPRCRVAYKKLLYDMGVEKVFTVLQEKTFIHDFPGLIVYADKVKDEELKDVLMYKLDGDGKYVWCLRAEEGRLLLERTNETITVFLKECWYTDLGKGVGAMYVPEAEYTTNLINAPKQQVKLSDMTFQQLREQLQDLRARINRPGAPGGFDSSEDLAEGERDITQPVKMHLHRQASFSFACVAFTLVGIPLGLRAHRKETTFGIFLALILVLAYYSFFILGNALKGQPELHPHLMLWFPNFLFQTVGGVLLWRANRVG